MKRVPSDGSCRGGLNGSRQKNFPVRHLFRKRPYKALGGRSRQVRCTAIGFQKCKAGHSRIRTR